MHTPGRSARAKFAQTPGHLFRLHDDLADRFG
jgi:hypothetical protein